VTRRPIGLEKRLAQKRLSGKDRVGRAAQILATTGGAAAGAAVAAPIASAAGASTLLGSATLATALGGVFVVTTPIGWVIGTAAVGYGLSALAKSGGRQDRIREELTRRLSERTEPSRSSVPSAFFELLVERVRDGTISTKKAAQIGDLVLNGALKPEIAAERLRALPVRKRRRPASAPNS